MKTFYFIIFYILMILSNKAIAQNQKVLIGYLPEYRFSKADQIDYSKLTQVNVCFANPDSNGVLFLSDTLGDIMQYIKYKNPSIKIYISLAGGALYKEQSITWKKMIDKPKNRPQLIQNIIDFVYQYQFDGVDVDLEWKDVSKGYSDFVLELKKALPEQIKLTAALPAIYRYPNISNKAINSFDCINIMAYDETGSWAPHLPGQHSSTDFAKRSILFWQNEVGIPSQKLTLGLPLYAYDFSDINKTTSKTIAEVLRQDYNLSNQDSIGLVYYNGKATLEEKVRIAIEEFDLKGIMLWELGQDTSGIYSILNTVNEALEKAEKEQFLAAKKKQDEKRKTLEKEIAFDRFKKEVEINSHKKWIIINFKQIDTLKVRVFDLNGVEQKLRIRKKKNENRYKIKKMKRAVYKLVIANKNFSIIKKIKF